MRADDLSLRELIHFEPGGIDLYGRRLVLHDCGSLGHLRRELVEMVGIEHARCLFTRFGFYWGQSDAAAMARVFEWDDPLELLKAGPRMHALAGATAVEVLSLDADRSTGRFNMEVAWDRCSEADEHTAELGPSTEPVCWVQTGYASGYATFWLGANVYFIERRCRGAGADRCIVVGKDQQSWGDEIKPYLKYFLEVDAIQTRILQLTAELRQKDHQIVSQRRRIDQLRALQKRWFTEVHSNVFRQTLDLAGCVARFNSSILITGESGSGKEMLARYIHGLSERSDRIFLAVNCSSLPETLLESELFGHKAGSFTGAVEDRVGLFEQANGGTLLLDEIGDISPAMQARLLRVVQEKEIMRVGESIPRKIDVRIIAATNRDLPRAVREERFREDLYYRLGVIEMEVPPLRRRPEDILPLVRHFIERHSAALSLPNLRLDARCVDPLIRYAWPGNVRELENVLERAAILSRDGVITPDVLPAAITAGRAAAPAGGASTLAQVEQAHIQAVLEQTNGNRTKAAEILGISPPTLWRKLKSLNL